MKLRFRFTVLFSLLFSVLLLTALAFIAYFFSQARLKDFQRRLQAQAYFSYSNWYHSPLSYSKRAIVSDYHPFTTNQLQVLILNDAGDVLYCYDKSKAEKPAAQLLTLVQKNKIYNGRKDSLDFTGLYMPAPHTGYVFVSSYDKFGLLRKKNLERILSIVAVVGISLIVCSAILIVNQITKPLIRLGLQMQGISENNLQERIQVKSSRFNHEEAQIASHFNAMLNRLERAFELQRSFVHHASHELRTPLATMYAQTEHALRKNLTIEEARKTLESLKDDQQEMIELTNSLLLLSRYEKDHTSPDWPVVRLDELLYETMSMVKRMLPNVNVSLEFAHIPENELFLSIQGNDSLIRSAFRNLIKNAWLYSDNKSVAVTIDATSTDIYLHFDNNGKLLSSEEQERVFVPFFRASNSVQKKGFGLGLNIIQRIISLHKGSINYLIYNNLNRFTLQFPKLPSANIDL